MAIETENGEPIMHVISDDEKKLFDKLKKIVLHANAEKYEGVYFICGETGEKDSLGLPEGIMVCPAFGLDGFAYYKKEKDYTAPDW